MAKQDQSPLMAMPIEIHHLIFGFLGLIQIFICQLISKKFNKIVKAFRVRAVLLSFKIGRIAWHYDRKPIYPCNAVSNRKVPVLGSTSIEILNFHRVRHTQIRAGFLKLPFC